MSIRVGRPAPRLVFSAFLVTFWLWFLTPVKVAAAGGPGITTQPQNQSVVLGSNAVFTVAASGQTPLFYQWSVNGTNLTNSTHVNGATNSTLTIQQVVAPDAGRYQVVVSNSHGSVTSSNATLMVLFPPAVAAQPSNQSVLLTSNASFVVSVTGTAPLSLQWYFNGAPLIDGGRISGSATANLNIANVQTDDAGTYQLFITNSYGSATSLVATLTVLVPVQIIGQPSSEAVQLNNNASFSVTAIGTSLSYQWYLGGTPLSDGNRISGSTTPTLKIANVQNNDLGGYSVLVTNSFSSMMSQTALLTSQAPFTFVTNLDNTVTITGFNGTLSGNVAIPDWIVVNGINLPVTKIGLTAFSGQSITSVTMGANLIHIGDGAFNVCSNLSSVIIGPNVVAIGVQAFGWCTNLTGIIIPDSVTSIGSGAFQRCSGLTNITIPNSVTSMMGNSTFEGCVSLAGITLPDSLTDIGWSEFYNCSNLMSISLPFSVTNIEDDAFSGCTGLTNIALPNGLAGIGNYAFAGCAALDHITIPGSVNRIGSYVFSGTGLTNITILDGVTSIPDYAFTSCKSLASVTIPGSITGIGNGAFSFCDHLVDVEISNGVSSIGNDAFESCTSLTSIVLPDSVMNIGYSAFSYCSGLTRVILSKSLSSIVQETFFGCTGLTNITIPSGVTNIEDYVFDGCTSLTTINADPANPVFCSVAGVLFDKSQTTILIYPVGKQGAYTIPYGTTSIAGRAFAECLDLTSVTVPNTVANIGGLAFLASTNLTEVFFEGDAPSTIGSVFTYDPQVEVYYLPGTTGWGPTFSGSPTALWNPQIEIGDGSFGIRSNQFGFDITGSSNLVLVVEASTTLRNAVWSPVGTNTLNGGSAYFVDPRWTNYPSRYYRIRSP